MRKCWECGQRNIDKKQQQRCVRCQSRICAECWDAKVSQQDGKCSGCIETLRLRQTKRKKRQKSQVQVRVLEEAK